MKDNDDIIKTVMDYGQGWYRGDKDAVTLQYSIRLTLWLA
jgi:hypothetical protein